MRREREETGHNAIKEDEIVCKEEETENAENEYENLRRARIERNRIRLQPVLEALHVLYKSINSVGRKPKVRDRRDTEHLPRRASGRLAATIAKRQRILKTLILRKYSQTPSMMMMWIL
ncbi:hypothetical protein KC19_VG152400 [Ceratodon purpureus]|uniref:Uncharacterized protein n=1 Tax=Ceratodon purpureus TaxID=3225 RepID=A0A8T0HQS7_CERPU|nr:hypothetical protein KC19_VG152400 [Ceratodon purpureus]